MMSAQARERCNAVRDQEVDAFRESYQRSPPARAKSKATCENQEHGTSSQGAPTPVNDRISGEPPKPSTEYKAASSRIGRRDTALQMGSCSCPVHSRAS